jgi:hypothetical protein
MVLTLVAPRYPSWVKLSLLMAIRRGFLLFIAVAMLASAALAGDADNRKIYDITYSVKLRPADDTARVTISIEDARLLSKLDFNLNPDIHSDIKANGQLDIENGRAVWVPPEKNARLSLRAKVSHKREDGEFDALLTESWAIFRGDDLVPSANVTAKKGARSRSVLEFKLPTVWPNVNTGWEEISDGIFRIDNPSRRFDRPTGWMIAGELGTRRNLVGDTHIAVSAPVEANLHRMDVLAFLNFIWPALDDAFGQTPSRLLVVGAGDPMWRGGLSASNSLFLHEERPLVSENGTSPLVHELVHMVTGIRGAPNHDWIAEGLAEFYSVELIYRAGGMTDSRRDKVFDDLSDWGDGVKSLMKKRSTGATTARATVLFDALDREIRKRSDDSKRLDDLVRPLLNQADVSLKDLRKIAEDLVGGKLETLESPLLK